MLQLSVDWAVFMLGLQVEKSRRLVIPVNVSMLICSHTKTRSVTFLSSLPLFKCSHLFSTGFFCLTQGFLKLALASKWKPVIKNLQDLFVSSICF